MAHSVVPDGALPVMVAMAVVPLLAILAVCLSCTRNSRGLGAFFGLVVILPAIGGLFLGADLLFSRYGSPFVCSAVMGLAAIGIGIVRRQR